MLYAVWETTAKFVLYVGNRKFNTQTEEWMNEYAYIYMFNFTYVVFCIVCHKNV